MGVEMEGGESVMLAGEKPCIGENVRIAYATRAIARDVIEFMDEHLHAHNEELYNGEFLCPDGLRAGIARNQVLIAYTRERIVAALRFYPKKAIPEASLYQFAVAPSYRGQQLIKQMVTEIGRLVVSRCPVHTSLNAYYEKTEWTLRQSDSHFNHWVMEP